MAIPLDLSAAVAPLRLDADRWPKLAHVEWRLRLVPAGKMAELLAEELAAIPARPRDGAFAEWSPEEQAAWGEAFNAAQKGLRPVYRELVRWGVVGWTPGKAPQTEVATYATIARDVLTPAQVDVLEHVENGALLVDLALAVKRANTITEEQALGFL